MATRDIIVQRFSTVSSRAFNDVVADLNAGLGHPDVAEFTLDMSAAKSFAEIENIVENAVGTSGFMEFARFDMGAVLRKRSGAQSPQILRIVLGNPILMSQMARYVPDAASYAPVTLLIDERPDGVHLSYDRMASYLAPYANLNALDVARELDAKVEALLMNAARGQTPQLGRTA